jgi:hypothetical protein
MSRPIFRVKLVGPTKEDTKRLTDAGFVPVLRWVTRRKPYEYLTTTQAKRKLTVN